ncbi:hypothetical protein C8N39_103374 [Dietzia psychralcaliphila]|nr:hypothetical protein C8N39_103374 [Dietzia psychralcaliphila]
MAQLKPRRMIADEGVPGVIRIVRHLLRAPTPAGASSRRRATFRGHDDALTAVGFVLRTRG